MNLFDVVKSFYLEYESRKKKMHFRSVYDRRCANCHRHWINEAGKVECDFFGGFVHADNICDKWGKD